MKGGGGQERQGSFSLGLWRADFLSGSVVRPTELNVAEPIVLAET